MKKTNHSVQHVLPPVGNLEDVLDGLDHLNKYQGLEEFFSSVTK